MRHVLILGLACLLSINTLFADEVWNTDRGDVVYLEDMASGIAVFQLIEDGLETRFYLQGLAGNFSDRDANLGYWISSSGPNPNSCPAQMTGDDGFSGKSWGQVMISHHEPAFPSSWSMIYTKCFGPMSGILRGSPR